MWFGQCRLNLWGRLFHKWGGCLPPFVRLYVTRVWPGGGVGIGRAGDNMITPVPVLVVPELGWWQTLGYIVCWSWIVEINNRSPGYVEMARIHRHVITDNRILAGGSCVNDLRASLCVISCTDRRLIVLLAASLTQDSLTSSPDPFLDAYPHLWARIHTSSHQKLPCNSFPFTGCDYRHHSFCCNHAVLALVEIWMSYIVTWDALVTLFVVVVRESSTW